MRCLFAVISLLAFALVSMVWADDSVKVDLKKLPPAAPGVIDFAREIQPILSRSCLKCHGPDKQKGGLRLDDSAAALKGGNSGIVIDPGHPDRSRLLQLVAGLDPELKMPPSGKPLTSEEVGRLRAWIDQGAKWSTNAKTAATTTKSAHWAFIPPKRPDVPQVSNRSWVRNEIDAFVLARLEAEKVAPSPEADRCTLIRRLSLDLLGLPPSLQEVDACLQDSRSDAYERLVDRLLASPHYGERWGRHWLDLARYADSDGFEKDTGRPYAWRYRNWVIGALNRDLPFDRFTIEQLAGDLLPNATLEQKIATGFHRNTLTNKEGGVDQEQYRVEQVVDRVNTTAKVFLGLTLGCAQCHDHKYDPFTQREYYQFFAFFNSDREVDLSAPLPGEKERYQERLKAFDRRKGELKASLAAYKKDELPGNQRKWEEHLSLPELRKLPPNISAILLIDPAKRSEKQKRDLADYYEKTDEKLSKLTKALKDHQKAAPKLTLAQTLALGTPRKTHVLIRGDFLRPGVEVEAGSPVVLPPLVSKRQPTRLDLAKWVVDPANPLTGRVIVNWMWQHYFGRGIVATLEDFGTQGDRPSHPELLDWLATELVAQKWSLKAMHKMIVMSATYRQSSQTRPELLPRDPLNVLLAHQNRPRLEAEIVRDVALASSGLLSRDIGGPSVHPPQPSGISELTYAGSAKWQESAGTDRYRRGMYTWFQRTSPYPMLMTFDAPESNVCCVRRDRTNTPLQALTLLNDKVFVECAQSLGQRVAGEKASSVPERIRYAFRLCLAREPAPPELATLARLFEDLLKTAKANQDAAAKLAGAQKLDMAPAEGAAWVGVARTIMNLDEFVTRE
jgi:hypothetical protein